MRTLKVILLLAVARSTRAQESLEVESCVQLDSLDGLDPLPTDSHLWFTAVFDNYKGNKQYFFHSFGL